MAKSSIMLRIGKTEGIEKQYNNCFLNFGCPANWIDLAKKDTTGKADKYEAVFAHVKKDDPRLLELGGGDEYNRAFGYWYDEGPEDTVFVRDVQMREIPKVVNSYLNMEKRWFDPKQPVYVNYVNYDLEIKDLFWKDSSEAVYSKQNLEKYRVQREARIVIPKTFFYGLPINMPYHELKVPVPGLQSYAHLVPATEFNSMLFYRFSEDYSRFTVRGRKKK